jgi:hypothetical protein
MRHLLDAPIYHMSEAFAHPEHASTWVAAIEGDPPVWDDFLAEYAAGVDAPFSTCWRDLAAAYPDAPVLLSHRGSAKVWHRSMDATVLPRTHDPEDVMAGYERWLVEVRAEIAPERLVEWQPGDGWEPICRALGVPVPNIPFPHENSTADYLVRAEIRAGGGR